jgi:hypothetical protein
MLNEYTPILIDNTHENQTEQPLSKYIINPLDYTNDIENDNISQLSIGHNDCVICLDPIELYETYSFDCNHQLHVQCFHKYFVYNYNVETNYISCPVCRQEMCLDMVQVNLNKDQVFVKKLLFSLKVFTIMTISTTSMFITLKYIRMYL